MVRISSVVKVVLALFQWLAYVLQRLRGFFVVLLYSDRQVVRHLEDNLYLCQFCSSGRRVALATVICASSFLVVDLRIATLHVYLLRSSAARTLEALFCTKRPQLTRHFYRLALSKLVVVAALRAYTKCCLNTPPSDTKHTTDILQYMQAKIHTTVHTDNRINSIKQLLLTIRFCGENPLTLSTVVAVVISVLYIHIL